MNLQNSKIDLINGKVFSPKKDKIIKKTIIINCIACLFDDIKSNISKYSII